MECDGPIGQFELVCGNRNKKANTKRVLIASNMQELDDWLKAFKQCVTVVLLNAMRYGMNDKSILNNGIRTS